MLLTKTSQDAISQIFAADLAQRPATVPGMDVLTAAFDLSLAE